MWLHIKICTIKWLSATYPGRASLYLWVKFIHVQSLPVAQIMHHTCCYLWPNRFEGKEFYIIGPRSVPTTTTWTIPTVTHQTWLITHNTDSIHSWWAGRPRLQWPQVWQTTGSQEGAAYPGAEVRASLITSPARHQAIGEVQIKAQVRWLIKYQTIASTRTRVLGGPRRTSEPHRPVGPRNPAAGFATRRLPPRPSVSHLYHQWRHRLQWLRRPLQQWQ